MKCTLVCFAFGLGMICAGPACAAPTPLHVIASLDLADAPTDDVILTWTDDGDDPDLFDGDSGSTSRLVDGTLPADMAGFAPSQAPIAQAGPFFLVAPDTIEMIGTVDSATPAQFAALIVAYPAVRRLVMIDCPGSVDEDANHLLARAVRRAGLSTYVPAGGSVRSGAVDLFLAGVRRSADATAEFGVHSWRDEDGNEADDFAAGDPVNTTYIAYYREMGLSNAAAQTFYALTNSVPFTAVRTLSAAEMSAMGLADIVG